MHRRRGALSAVEIVGACSAYFLATWWLGSNAQFLWAKVTFYLLLASGAAHVLWFSPRILHRDAPEIRGWGGSLSRSRLTAAHKPYVALSVIGAIVLLAIAFLRRPNLLDHLVWRSVLVKFVFYLPFAFVQSMFVFGFLMTRIRDVVAAIPVSQLPGSFARQLAVTLLTTVLFCALHIPNIPLMAFVFVAGMCWSWLFYRTPSILLLTLSHATLGTILHRFVELHMRVGPFYGHPNMHFTRTLIPGAKELIGNLY